MRETQAAHKSTPEAARPLETAARRLARLWREGGRPELGTFLAGEGDLSRAQLAAVLRVDQRERKSAGGCRPAEWYLGRFPTVADDPDLALDLVYGEYLLSEDAGERPLLDEYVERFPELAAAFEVQVDFHRALDPADAGGNRAAVSSAPALAEWGSAMGATRAAAPGAAASIESALAVDRTPPDLNLPTIPGYKILDQLGAGGMGVVYRAFQLGLKRQVALKMILPTAHADPAQLARFQVEAEAAASLHHPNIVEIYEIGEFGASPYFSLELVEGGNLAQQLGGRVMSPRKAGQLTEALANAMHFAHEHGVVHRDLKPGNVLLAADGTPKIADFGLAKILGNEMEQTCSGTVLGSPCYMSPEQALGEVHRVGPASDVYSLGAILYELLTGAPPFRSATALDTLQKMTTEEPVRPSRLRLGVPRDLETICLKCLEKDRSRRYISARALAEDLDRFLNYEPVQARPIARAERVWRFCRRKTALTMAIAMAALAVMIAIGVSVSFAIYQYRVATELKSYVRQVQVSERQNDRLAADLAYRHGHRLCEQGDIGHGMLWLVRGLKGASHAGNAELEGAFRLDLAAWRPRLHPLRLRWRVPPEVHALAFSPDGATVAIGGYDRMARLRDAATGDPVGIELEHPSGVKALAFGPDGRTLLTGCLDWCARLWDIASGRQIGPPMRHDEAVFAVAFSPDGRTAITGSADRTARLWDIGTGRQLGPALRHEHIVTSVAFSRDGSTVVTGSFDKTARMWDVATGLRVGSPLTHEERVSSVAFSPDSRTVLTGCYDGSARLWDRQSGSRVGKPMTQQHCISAVAISPDGRVVLTGSMDGTAQLWDVASGQSIGTVLRHRHQLESVAFSPDGRAVLTGGIDGTAQLWEVGSPTGLSFRHEGFIRKVIFSPNGTTVLSASEDGTARIWDASTGKPVGPPLRHGGAVWTLAVSVDGRLALTGSDDKTARLWNAATGLPLGPPLRHARAVKAVAFSPDGRTVITGSDDKTARLWSAATGEPIGVSMRHAAEVSAVEFSPDGRHALTGSRDATARLWEATTGRPVGPPFRHEGPVLAVAFRRDGKAILTGSEDMTARLWDAQTGLPLLAPLRHDGAVAIAAFSPDGRTVITGGWDRVARLWDSTTGRPVAPPLRHDGRLRALAISPDGNTVLTGSYDRTAQLWDKVTGRPIGAAFRHESQVWFVAFSPDGRTVLSGGQENAAHLWRVPTPSDETVAELELATQVATGMELDVESSTRLLTIGEWTSRRRQLATLRAEAHGLGPTSPRVIISGDARTKSAVTFRRPEPR